MTTLTVLEAPELLPELPPVVVPVEAPLEAADDVDVPDPVPLLAPCPPEEVPCPDDVPEVTPAEVWPCPEEADAEDPDVEEPDALAAPLLEPVPPVLPPSPSVLDAGDGGALPHATPTSRANEKIADRGVIES